MEAVLASFLASRAEHRQAVSAAIEAGDLQALERAAHRLKGALGTIRAPAAAAIAATLEQAACTADHGALSSLQGELQAALAALAAVLETD
jgi:HPt (histidine-containing phosphotransfer) domain-containing protein